LSVNKASEAFGREVSIVDLSWHHAGRAYQHEGLTSLLPELPPVYSSPDETVDDMDAGANEKKGVVGKGDGVNVSQRAVVRDELEKKVCIPVIEGKWT